MPWHDPFGCLLSDQMGAHNVAGDPTIGFDTPLGLTITLPA
jgi:hypothetical protein